MYSPVASGCTMACSFTGQVFVTIPMPPHRRRSRQAYNDAEAADRDAWRNPRRDAGHTGDNSRRSQDAMGLDPKQQAYLDYDNWSRDAWRSK